MHSLGFASCSSVRVRASEPGSLWPQPIVMWMPGGPTGARDPEGNILLGGVGAKHARQVSQNEGHTENQKNQEERT